MEESPTVAVLSPFFGGTYYGALLGGVAQRVREVEGRILALQTLAAGAYLADPASPPDYPRTVGLDRVQGLIVFTNAVGPDHCLAARDRGTPSVLVGQGSGDPLFPSVGCDNERGVREAVRHLLQHGHRRIAFAGCLVQTDIRERYHAFCATLHEFGLEPDPELFYDTGNNQESGGEAAARLMISHRIPATAVLTGNDYNALGLVRALERAGYDVPRDIAVIGFDDIESGAVRSPALTSVHQHIDLLGRTAADLLLRTITGEPIANCCHLVPTSLVVRETCGCRSRLSLTAAPPGSSTWWPAGGPPTRQETDRTSLTAEEPGERLTQVLQGTEVPAPGPGLVDRLITALHGTDADEQDIRTAAHQIAATTTELVNSALAGGPAPDRMDLERGLARLAGLAPRPETLVEVIRCVRDFARSAAAGNGHAVDPAVEDGLQEVILCLAQQQLRRELAERFDLQDRFFTQYAVSLGLLRSHEQAPRTLAWLARTDARGACLGLWTSPEPVDDSRHLELVGHYLRDPGPQGTPGEVLPDQAFPPQSLIDLADPRSDLMTFVVPIRTPARDWGLLAVVGTIDAESATGREPMNQWAALLTVALDHETVLRSLREQEERLRLAAMHDDLTELPNRALFLERLQHAIRRTQRSPERQFGLLLLDLDGFKVVNDSLGHLAGDQLLVKVAERLSTALRDTDIAGRFGGDEFAVLIEDVHDAEDLLIVVSRLQAALAAPIPLGEQELVVSASIGIALGNAGYADAESVIRDADIAMYSAKNRQKGSHAFFDTAMHARAMDRLRTEAQLRRALEGDELEVHYQPIVRLVSGRLAAFEALVRWRHPGRGLLLPGEFLPVAEDSGLILQLGRWVMRRSCQQLAQWQQLPGLERLSVSVNVSNRQFWHGRLVEEVTDCLRATGIDPATLSLEITESVIMHDVHLARRMLRELHDLGVHLHIDDFGTGYSSLEALHRLPLDALKIDKSFVAALDEDPRSAELVRTIVLMGSNLGLELIAEGVESPGHRDRLRDLGCAFGQGYWFSRPVPPDEAIALATAG